MTVDPNTPHDTLVKELLGSPSDAAAVLQTVLPGEVRAAIDWASLESDDTELRAKHDASTRTDLLFRAKARVGEEDHEVMVLVVIEHQSTDDWTMPLRMLETMTGLWRRFLRQHKQARSIPLIVPVLLSHTIGGWRTSRRFDDMFAIAPADLGLARYLPRLDLLLVDLTATQRDQLLAWAESLVSRGSIAQGTMLLWLAAVGETGDAAERVERALRHAASWLERLLTHDREQAELLLVYLTLTTKLTGPVVAAMLSKQGAQQAASTMSTLHEMWEAQQRERVFAEGKREGEREGKREGEREGKQKTLVKQLTLKFGDLSEPDLLRIAQADAAVLETYLERVLTADSIAAVLGPE
jgi:predicted transposase YdaD